LRGDATADAEGRGEVALGGHADGDRHPAVEDEGAQGRGQELGQGAARRPGGGTPVAEQEDEPARRHGPQHVGH